MARLTFFLLPNHQLCLLLKTTLHNYYVLKNYEEFYENFGIPVERVASVIQQVIDVPADSAWNEVIIRPTKQVQ